MRRGRVPARGDLVWLEFNPQAGSEQSGHRPALVISPRNYNSKTGLALMCPITSRLKGYPFEVELPQGLRVRGAVLCDQIKSLDWRVRHAERVETVPDAVMQEVTARLLALIESEE